MSHNKGPRSRLTLRLPAALAALLEERAHAAGIDVNTLINKVLLEHTTGGTHMATSPKTTMTLSRVYETVARSLREFGYSDVTAEMVKDTHEAMKKDAPTPHGIVGKFAQSQLREVWDTLNRMAP